ncbi:response regulator transcription factor [Mesoterricola silvestris]|uniref:DNA-binding response regulator n=1 Tax=Mesoterricola silvestris TaxID=2927979 RepID=A0AA48KAE4_9BACT|nr:response regulator transcription factor [Mesoterricola silvestris]BDU71438.1 DNA-binding response regulator [Mesoterricola silvestris]
MQRILVVEDQRELSETLRSVLTFEGFQVLTAGDGEKALECLGREPVDLVVLDLMLPVLDGYQVVARLRKQGSTVGVLMLTARGEEGDRIRGLKLGADDYLVKPFSMLELLERIKAILRRTRPATGQPVLVSGPFRLESASMKVLLDGQPLDLTAKQFLLLELLLAHPGTTLDRSEMLRHVWPPDSRPSLRAVDVHMARLRKKIGDTEATGYIRSIASAGYRWALPVTPL